MTELGYTDSRPVSAVPYTFRYLTRSEILTKIAGKRAAGPGTDDIVEDISFRQLAMACIDARRDAEGNLSATDQHDYDCRSAELPKLYRQLGLYPI